MGFMARALYAPLQMLTGMILGYMYVSFFYDLIDQLFSNYKVLYVLAHMTILGAVLFLMFILPLATLLGKDEG